jgi:hypothetical protein
VANFNAGGNKRGAAEVIPPTGMFVFSKPMHKESYLHGWQIWFFKKGIHTVVAWDKKGDCYLCREGIEAKERWRKSKGVDEND